MASDPNGSPNPKDANDEERLMMVLRYLERTRAAPEMVGAVRRAVIRLRLARGEGTTSELEIR